MNSLSELQAMFDIAPVGMAQTDAQRGVFRRVNARLCAMTGFREEELLRISPRELTHPDDRTADEALFQKLYDGEIPEYIMEKRYVRKDGGVTWVRAHLTLLRDAEGRPSITVGVLEDITERKSAEATLELYSAALQAAANPVVIVNQQGLVCHANAAACQSCGCPEQELIGQPPRIFGSGLQPPGFYQELEATVRQGKVWHGEIANRRRDGTIYYEDLTVSPLYSPNGQLEHAVAIKQDITARVEAEAALRASQERYRCLVDSLEAIVFSVGPTGRLTFVSKSVSSLGYRPESLMGRRVEKLLTAEGRAALGRWRRGERDGLRLKEWTVLDAAGEERLFRVSLSFQQDKGTVTGVAVDVTAQRATEEQLLAALKMEAVGRLAGGVAHDFNNILSVILSYTDLAMAELHAGDPLREDLAEVMKAARRAETLTRQLLAFSRRQMMTMDAVDVNALVASLERMLGRLIGEDVALEVYPQASLYPIFADKGLLEQVFMNLAINARDAMPNGGRLTISTANTTLDELHAARVGVDAGDYVEIRVSDTGHGMDESVKARIFEPFFTTKAAGKGTGLGLPMVYGIVRQSSGGLYVESQPGKGSTFHIFLPRSDGYPAESLDETPSEETVDGGDETILVVEDEQALLNLARRTLSSAGYRVFSAANGGEAFMICESRGEEIDLVLSDVVMPGINGVELQERLRRLCPRAAFKLMSGYPNDALSDRGVSDQEILAKPFGPVALRKAVREALNARPDP